VLHRRRPIGRDYAAYFARPYAVVRTVCLVVLDVFRERAAAAYQRRLDVRPRIERSRMYSVVRAWGTVVQLDLQIAAVVGDILAGRPVVYTTFLAYDEVAHHSGIERPDAIAILRQVDRQIARVKAATRDAPRPYRLVVLSDHGQSQGDTFLDRYDKTLEQVVTEACEATDVHAASGGEDESLAYLSAGLTEVSRDNTAGGRAARAIGRGRQADGAVTLGEDAREEVEETRADDEIPELSVMASGNLGLISFPREPGRVTLEWLDEHHPRLVPALREHPGIGFLLVRSEDRGSLVLGENGIHHLADGRVEGEDPLAPYGPNAADHVRRTDSFPHCADIMLNSTWWEDMEEVAAFEELVGSHGGMGGTQSHPFVLHPSELPWPREPVIGAEKVHRIFRAWLWALGQDAYGVSASDSPGSSSATWTEGASSAM